jgi:hypothetical protein
MRSADLCNCFDNLDNHLVTWYNSDDPVNIIKGREKEDV